MHAPTRRAYACRPLVACVTLAMFAAPAAMAAEQTAWETLFATPPYGTWRAGGDARLDPADPARLEAIPGQGVLLSSEKGTKADRNLVTSQAYGDAEFRLEFMLARGSNAGVKLHGLYELQLYDSHGKADPKATDSGGIYPRAVRKPSYHHITEGRPPLVNAAKPAGEWQELAIRFRAPRFDGAGVMTSPAVFEEVRLNGEVVQRSVAVDLPTGAYWHKPQGPTGPLYLQGDHGAVAYRNVRVRRAAAQRR